MRLITVMLFLSVLISATVAADYTATLSPDDPLSHVSNNPQSNSTKESPSKARTAPANASQDIAPIVQQLAAVVDQAAPNQKAQYNQAMRENRANDIAVRDLVQQREIAHFAQYLFVTAAIGTCLGVLGMLLLYQTLVHTRRTANAAVDQLKQNRAWVVYKRTSAGRLVGDTFTVAFYVANLGQSPANNIVIKKAKYGVQGTAIADPGAAMGNDAIDSVKAGVLGPGVEFALNFSFSQADMREVMTSSENKKMIVWINITYETLQIKNATTEHTFEIVPVISDATGNLVEMSCCPIGPRNSAT